MCFILRNLLKSFGWTSQSEQQEKLEATGQCKRMLHIVGSPYTYSDMCCLCVSLSAAFLGDIALDEEDLRSFKVDRIIDLAARTVQVVNRTNTGNNNRQKDL